MLSEREMLRAVDELTGKVRERIASEPMTPLERLRMSGRFEEPDRVPILLQIHEYAARAAGLPVKTICTSPIAHVYSQLLALDRYGHDLPCAFADVYNIEAEALGCTLHYPGETFPEIAERAVTEPGDLAKLTIPDGTRAARMPWVLEVNDILGEKLGDVMGIYGAVSAPFSVAANLRGFEQLLVDMYDDPDFVHALMDFVTEVVVSFGKLQVERGAQSTTLIDAWAAPPLLSLELFDEFVLPYTARALGALKPPGVSWGGIWGCSHLKDWRSLIRRVIAAGSGNVRAFGLDTERGVDLGEMKELLTRHRRPMLCTITAELMHSGPPERIAEKTREYIQKAAPGGGFVIYAAMVPIETPPEHLDAFISAARTFGTYPIEQDRP